jgi:hypothetical protein
MWWARFTAVLLGLWIIAAQYVPWWLGSRSRPTAVIPLGDTDPDGDRREPLPPPGGRR